MKKFFLIMIVGLVFISAISAGAQNNEIVHETFGDWEVISNATGWTLVSYRGNETDIVIPERFDDILVTEIAAELFMNDIFLERIVIPGAVSNIGRNAFNGCVSLKEVQLPLMIKTIQEGTFKDCISLESIAFPASLTSIGKEAFANCQKIQLISLTQRISSLGESAFENCSSLRNIYVQKNLSTLGAKVFNGTAWLENQSDEFVILGRGLLVKYNGNDKDVVIPYGVVAIADVFADNTTVETVKLPDTVRRIMQNAFKGAINLRTVNIPPWVTTIGASAFSGCKSLTSIEFPGTLTSIGSYAFESCDQLTDLVIPEKVKTIPARLAQNSNNLEDIQLPDETTRIDKNAFAGLDHVRIHVTPGSSSEDLLKQNGIEYTYNTYRNNDFIYIKDLKSVQIIRYIGNDQVVSIPEYIDELPVTEIQTAAFQNNKNVRIVNLPETIKSIDDWAFSYMDNLEYVKTPDSLRRIGNYAFRGSDKLSSFRFAARTSSVGKEIFSRKQDTMVCADEGTKVYYYLLDQGYIVYSPDMCTAGDNFRIDNIVSSVSCNCDDCFNSEDQKIIQIPDNIKTLSADLLRNAGSNIILSVPSSVEIIEPEILGAHNLTIIGEPDSEAETFAVLYGLKFLVRLDLWTVN